MNLIELLSLLFVHYFADFIIQTDKQAKLKSENNLIGFLQLLCHVSNYSLILWIFSLILFEGQGNLAFNFCGITFISHLLIDYITSRINKKLWEDNKRHQFFMVIGFDQWLHYIQLLTTYFMLK